ncbi:Clp protease N-terminal domain-containing protein [Kutzneria sp. 744]|uniref:Clp protease N-terminal domain-containing protein n=1 Tax=Kutzneria sp. (strain 744) TaxID=345341 RepID=UPI0003EEDEE2|nr:Clp protease N-terminal domain-containing protein [Kutzneria sp. 744]EWM16647.1 ATP-dependent Clp protease ATP-binding subunit ClpC [Kutzneria sp. 744]
MTTPRLDDMITLVATLHPDGDPLDRLSEAVLLADRLGELSDHLVGHFVDQARRAGSTWTDIGRSMGVSKQAAQKRFVPKDEPLDWGPFSRFTDLARKVVAQSQTEAQTAGHGYIGTEHVLLALISLSDGLAAKALIAQGLTEEQVRAAVKVAAPAGGETVTGHIPFTPRVRKVLELAVREALRLEHNFVGTEHILLGLMAEGEGIGVKVLTGLGVNTEELERHIVAKLSELLRERRGE